MPPRSRPTLAWGRRLPQVPGGVAHRAGEQMNPVHPGVVRRLGRMSVVRVLLPAVLAGTLCASGLASCRQEGEAEEGLILHPTPENSLPGDAPLISSNDSLPRGLSAEALAAWREVRRRIVGASPGLSLGAPGLTTGKEATPDVFGGILDVEFDRRGNILVVDDLADEVRVFDGDGRFLERLGGTGHGPLEFQGVGEVEILGDDRVAVAQGHGNPVKVFRRSASGSYSLDETFHFNGELQGIGCEVKDRLFVSGHSRVGNTIFHEFALGMEADSVRRRYGVGYQSEHWLVRDQFSEGPIACLRNPLRVIWAYLMFPEVRLYGPDADTLLWAARVHPFTQGLLKSRSDGLAVRYNYVTNADRIINLVGLDDGSAPHEQILLQVQRWFPRDSTLVIRTYLIDASTGSGALLSDTLPLIKAWRRTRYAAVWRDEPFPRLQVQWMDR